MRAILILVALAIVFLVWAWRLTRRAEGDGDYRFMIPGAIGVVCFAAAVALTLARTLVRLFAGS